MNRIIIMILSVSLLSFACAQKAKQEATGDVDLIEVIPQGESKAAPVANSLALPQAPRDVYGANHRIIKKAHYRFETTDVRKTLDAITDALGRYDAFIASSSQQLEGGYMESKVVVRVANIHFPEMLKVVDGLATKVVFRNITTDDVSKDFVDLESRLKTKREVQERYTSILRSKAGTIEELLEAERQIGVLQEEIEATISRLNFLRDQVAYSTLDLEFFAPAQPQLAAEDTTPSVGEEMTKAFMTGLRAVGHVALVLVYLWPLVLASGAGYWLYRRRRRPAATV